MNRIIYIERTTGERKEEQVYGKRVLAFLYGKGKKRRLLAALLLHLFAKRAFFSWLYGWWQKSSWSKRKIKPFIAHFQVDTTEFLQSDIEAFTSFNDFFIRKLKPDKRPIAAAEDSTIIPADGRYFFYQNVAEVKGFIVKEKRFSLTSLLEDELLAKRYAYGSMAIARLCPTDYHRFHFPCDCIPEAPRCINGWLYSVNPVALKRNCEIFTQNKRVITQLNTTRFGKVLFIEIGATNVGSIHQSFSPHTPYRKGDEKGFFSFGASALVLLFEPECLGFDQDLLAAAATSLEIRCLMGQSMGTYANQ